MRAMRASSCSGAVIVRNAIAPARGGKVPAAASGALAARIVYRYWFNAARGARVANHKKGLTG